ncbi:unnamed protein product [marine sediment metagenome]|uniref:Uncharacterized protein n=1 Tax=marine sediment metagenome TaxID=412755 RepID=X0XHY2_9ZZZZ
MKITKNAKPKIGGWCQFRWPNGNNIRGKKERIAKWTIPEALIG